MMASSIGRSELVLVFLPLTGDTEGLLDAERLAKLPEGAALANLSRGELVDEEALLEALDSGWISEAYLDVFAREPLPAEHRYWTHPRVHMTPHVAALTPHDVACEQVAEKIRRLEAGLPVSGVVGRGDVMGALKYGEASDTWSANPLACATALASLDLLESSDHRAPVTRIEASLTEGLDTARELPNVVDVRVLGAIGVIELEGPVDLQRSIAAATGAGVWLRPFRNLIYAMPPYVCTNDEIGRICNAMVAVADAHNLGR